MNIPHAKIVFLLKTFNIFGISYLILTLAIHFISSVYVSLNNYSEKPNPISYHIFMFTICMLVSSIYFFKRRKNIHIIEYRSELDINKNAILLDYYSFLLPNFFFFISYLFIIIGGYYFYNIYNGFDVDFDNYYSLPDSQIIILASYIIFVFTVSIIFFILYPLLFSYFFFLKRKYDKSMYITVKMSSDIFTSYLNTDKYSQKENFYIEKFSYYFSRLIKNIDNHLEKGVKIEDLEHDNAIRIKQLIAENISIYLKYGTQKEIISLKHNIYSLYNFINSDNQVNNLEITKPVFKIYVDIKDFLIKRNYKVRQRNKILDLHLLLYIFPLAFLAFLLLFVYLDSQHLTFCNFLIYCIRSFYMTLIKSPFIIPIIPTLVGAIITYIYRE